MTSKTRKITQNNNIKSSSKTKLHKKRKMKRRTRKMNGGFINISGRLNRIRESMKTKFLNILMTGQTPEMQDKIKTMMENDSKFKKMNLKIDLFMDRVETLIQNFVQTATTTTVKVTTSWLPGISFIGALITTAINWTILCVKSASRGYDFYKIYSEMQQVIEKEGGQKIDLSARVGNLQKEAIAKVANITVPSQISSKMKAAKENVQNKATAQVAEKAGTMANEVKNKATKAAINTIENVSGKTTSQLQANADEVKSKIESKVKDAVKDATIRQMKQMPPKNIAKLASVRMQQPQ